MSSFEKALVYHCSPTLCGLKPANLLSLSKDEYPHLPQLTAAYARLLEDKGIRLTILCSCGCRWLLLVYHQSMLAAQLKQPAVVRLLAQAGYPVEAPFSLEQLLRCLSRRLRQSRDCRTRRGKRSQKVHRRPRPSGESDRRLKRKTPRIL